VFAYLPALFGSLYLDDYSSLGRFIDVNGKASWTDLKVLVQAETSGPLGRPAVMWTFALQTYFGLATPFQFKLVNLVLHVSTAFLVGWYWNLVYTSSYRCPSTSSEDGVQASFFAIIVASIWLGLAIHISTVMYSVQRMAIMSAMFMLSTMISYEYLRVQSGNRKGFYLAVLALTAFFILSVFSKENAIISIAIIIARELFSRASLSRGKQNYALVLLIPLSFITLHYILIFIGHELFAEGYARRNFDSAERLMTQYDAVTQMVVRSFWPDSETIGIYQDDFTVRSSLFGPNGAFPHFVAVGFIFCFSIWSLLSRKWLFLGFCASGFLISHIVESTVLPLELYFEHRNYFPIIFALAALCHLLLRVFSNKIFLALALLFCMFQLSRLSEIAALMGKPVLYAYHTMEARPNSERAINVVAELNAGAGRLSVALMLSRRQHEISSEPFHNYLVRDFLYYCLSQRSPDDDFYERFSASSLPMDYPRYLVNLISELEAGTCKQGDVARLIDKLDSFYFQPVIPLARAKPAKVYARFYQAMGVLSAKLSRFTSALYYIDQAIALDPDSTTQYRVRGEIAIALGDATVLRQTISLMEEYVGQLTHLDKVSLERYREILNR
jgi:tetratricopeptide (TPR) repeat protein